MRQTRLDRIRKDFPALHQEVHHKPLVYFDNAATSQKPQVVIDRMAAYYQSENSNVHRGVHFLSQQATDAYEGARIKVADFIHAAHSREVIYTKGTTEGINLLAFSFGEAFVKAGDEILISALEHHSNIVPWQLLCLRKNATLKVIPMQEDGSLDIDALPDLLSTKTRLVSVVHTSNALGIINPVRKIIQMAHQLDIPVLLDAAQAIPHQKVDVQDLDVDFMVFSGHKMFGPTGIGILYGKEKWLDKMPPFLGGGDMIKTVRFEASTFAELPHKFEAGTPNIAGGIGLGAGIDYLNQLGFDWIQEQEQDLLDYGTEQLKQLKGLRIFGDHPSKASVISFLLGDIHPYDCGTILDQLGIAVRTGHHCTQPIMQYFGIPGTVRASFAFYNTREEIDILVAGLQRVQKMFG